jgi:hypothetical protein
MSPDQTVTLPDWLTVGARVAILGGGPFEKNVEVAKVERIMKRDIVLDNGDRYSRDSLRRRGEGSYGPWRTLCAPTDPEAIEAARRQRIKAAAYHAENALRRWRDTSDPRDGQAAIDLINRALHAKVGAL